MASLSSLAMAGQCFDEVSNAKIKQPTKAVALQLNHALSTPPDNFCLQQKRIYYPLYIKATLLINFYATVIVGTYFSKATTDD